jgi:hypothetical protein
MEGINGKGSTSKSRRDNIIYVPDAPFNASPQVPYDYSSLSDSDPVICIDNGKAILSVMSGADEV